MLANHLVTYTDGSSKLFENSELYKLCPDVWVITQGNLTTMIFTASVRSIEKVNATHHTIE